MTNRGIVDIRAPKMEPLGAASFRFVDLLLTWPSGATIHYKLATLRNTLFIRILYENILPWALGACAHRR
jgi:hypothetical protein